jgi:hypothetical protein
MTDREKISYLAGIMHASTHAGCCFGYFEDEEQVEDAIAAIAADLEIPLNDPRINEREGEMRSIAKARWDHATHG